MADITDIKSIVYTEKTIELQENGVIVVQTSTRMTKNGLKEVLTDFEDQFQGKIYLGTRSGFLDKIDMEALNQLAKENKNLILKTVNEAIDAYCEDVKNLID